MSEKVNVKKKLKTIRNLPKKQKEFIYATFSYRIDFFLT